MPLADSFFGWFVILMLYVIIGIMAGAGSVFISQKIFKGANERRFYAFFLFVIAGFYAAFVAHFGDNDAWRTELTAIALFSLLSFLGAFCFVRAGNGIPDTWGVGYCSRTQSNFWHR